MCLTTSPLLVEVGVESVDFVLREASLLVISKSCCAHANTLLIIIIGLQMKSRQVCNKEHNCEMGYCKRYPRLRQATLTSLEGGLGYLTYSMAEEVSLTLGTANPFSFPADHMNCRFRVPGFTAVKEIPCFRFFRALKFESV